MPSDDDKHGYKGLETSSLSSGHECMYKKVWEGGGITIGTESLPLGAKCEEPFSHGKEMKRFCWPSAYHDVSSPCTKYRFPVVYTQLFPMEVVYTGPLIHGGGRPINL